MGWERRPLRRGRLPCLPLALQRNWVPGGARLALGRGRPCRDRPYEYGGARAHSEGVVFEARSATEGRRYEGGTRAAVADGPAPSAVTGLALKMGKRRGRYVALSDRRCW